MKSQYNLEINVLEKIEEIAELFKEHNPKVFSQADKGYDWLEEADSKCIVMENPYGGESIEIGVGDMEEFTLFFAGGHAHFGNDLYDYGRLLACVRNILQGAECAGRLMDSAGTVYGAGFFEKEKVTRLPEEVFQSVFRIPLYADQLLRIGYRVEYTFWNPMDNQTVVGE